MGKIADEARKFISLCADCKHPKIRHMKPTYRDQQRQTTSSMKATDSECLECKKEGKKCQQFRPSK